MKVAALALVFNSKGEVLAVSRKTDHNDLGFPGGKPESIDGNNLVSTAEREVYEETGLYVKAVAEIWSGSDGNGFECVTYLCKLVHPDNENVEFTPGTGETGRVCWATRDQLMAGSYGSYNYQIFTKYDNLLDYIKKEKGILCGCHYMNPKTGEAFHLVSQLSSKTLDSSEDYYVVRSSFGHIPLLLPVSAMTGFINIPEETFNRSRVRVLDMEINPGLYSIAERAKVFSVNAHNQTYHFYDVHQYGCHLADVVNIHHRFKHLIPEEKHDRVEAELWGHDTIEDTRKTRNDVMKALDNETAAEGIYAMTNEKGRNRKQRANSKYYQGLKENEFGEYKKLCDRIANVEAGLANGGNMVNGYRKELPEFEKELMTENSPYMEMWNHLRTILNVQQTATI